MSFSLEKFQEKIAPIASAAAENKYLKAISDAVNTALPIILIGSFSVLFAFLSPASWQNFITKTGLKSVFTTINTMTMGLLALYVCFIIAYRLATFIGVDAISCGILALGAFLIATPIASTVDNVDSIPVTWLGFSGLFLAIILGLIVPKIYAVFMEKKLYIKMPEGVPPIVERSMASLIPAFVILGFMGIVSVALSKTSFGSLHNIVYSLIQTPLTNLGGSFAAYLLMQTLCALFMFFGIHGGTVLNIFTPILIAMGAENLQAYQAGAPLPHIISFNFAMVYGAPGGIGGTIGLAILMAFFAKSVRYRTVGKIAIIPSFFGINEPVIFGVPILLNPLFFIPYILSAVIHNTLAYVLTAIGILPRLIGLQIPWTVPPIISGFLSGGIRPAIFQIFQILLSIAIYYPFFKIIDNNALKMEKEPCNIEQ